VSEYIPVSKEQFYKFSENFLNKTGVKLERDVTMICEPPCLSLNDFSDGKVWPESMCAKGVMWDGSEYHKFKQAEYSIKKEYFDLYGVE